MTRPKLQHSSKQSLVESRRPSVVPLWAQPSGALGRLVSRDPHQRWITSTISSLFRYHDERFIKFVLCGLIMQSSRKGEAPLSEYQLAWHPDTLRLGEVVSKVIHSNWLHIANAGLLGSESECPHLPVELQWACEKGHNVENYKLSLVMSRLLDPPAEIIFQSEHLLTNLVLWLLWHWNGRIRVIVSGRVEYDEVLGLEPHTIECRVSKFCSRDGECASTEAVPTFRMLENISGSLKMLFGGKYNSQQTLMSEPRVRQWMYHSPFQYPKGSQNGIKIQTQRTAQEILRWFVERPVSKTTFSSRLEFHVSLTSGSTISASELRIGDLLGRTPGLLNMQCGDLGRAFVVFSLPRETTPPTVENFMEVSSENIENMEDIFEDRPETLLKYFPILQDLIDCVRESCKCFHCHGQESDASFRFDENCLQYKAFMEVMLHLAHGIADGFGAPDVSCCTEAQAGDSGATAVLLDVIEGVRMGSEDFEGVVRWNTLLSTSTQVFLGCPPLDKLTDATYNDASVDTSPHFMQHLSSSIIAVQYGDLAVVAPWLDISQQLSCHGCFRFAVVQGRLGLPIDQTSGSRVLQELARDIAVLETQHTEDVSDYASRHKVPEHASNSAIEILEDECEQFCDYVLVSVDQNRYKLLMRVSSKAHSRMVDPSMAMLRLSTQVFNVACKHAKSRSGVVPEPWTLELYEFDELLGRWGDTTERETISPDNSPEPSEGRSKDEDIPRDVDTTTSSTAVPSAATEAAKSNQTQKQRPLRLSHVLNSSFKYNTALALTGDDNIFVNRGDACLQCSLQHAVSFKEKGWRQNYPRWIISKTKSPERKVPRPRLRVQSIGRKGMLEASTKRKRESSSGLREDTMELDE